MISKFISPRAWFRALLKTSIHNGTASVLAIFGTNGAEKLAPEMLSGIGMTFHQAVAVFLVSASLSALRFISETTEETRVPFPPTPTPPP